MLIQKFQEEEYARCFDSASEEKKSALGLEVDDVIIWCGRLKQINVPDFEESNVQFVEMTSVGPREVTQPFKFRDYETSNKQHLDDVDKRVKDMFRRAKSIGFECRLSHLCYKYMEKSVFLEKVGRFDGNPALWHRVMLFLSRLRSTSRLVARFDNSEMFGPRTTENNGEILLEFGPDPWRQEMVRRGLIPKK